VSGFLVDCGRKGVGNVGRVVEVCNKASGDADIDR